MQVGVDVYSVDFYESEIKHRPSELLPLWVGDDLIGDAVVVVIGIDAELRTMQVGHAERLCETQTYAMLLGKLRFEVSITHIGIV